MYLTQGLHRAVQQSAHHAACVFNDRVTTFIELRNRVALIASVLRGLGVLPGDRVAMLAQNSDRFLECMLATWWVGATFVPINTRWSKPEIAHSLNEIESALMLTDSALAPRALELRATAPCLISILQVDDGDARAGALSLETLLQTATAIKDACSGGDALATILYTGGTTGASKGVMLSHMNLWASAVARMAQVPSAAGASMMHCAPLFHAAAMGRLIGQIIIGNASVILPAFRPEAVVDNTERHQVEELVLVPSMIQMLLDSPAFVPERLRSLSRITYGASPISETLLERVAAALPWVELVQSYGQTEASPVIALNSHAHHRPDAPLRQRTRAAGRACLSLEVRIVDDDDREVPRETVGEIIARGPTVMIGYWRRAQETVQALRNGWLHTGDAAFMDDDGYIYVVDRLKDMIITGGENVYSTEVENAIAQHPEVAMCAVIGVQSPAWGESVHAAVVLKTGATLTAEALRAHCATLIAGYKCPKTIEFRDELPLSPAGKVLKTALRRKLAGARSGPLE